LPKSEIENICKKNHIPYVTDASNYDDTTSLRNKLRNKVLPSLYALSKSQKGRETFENSMLNVYRQIEKLTNSKYPPLTKGGVGGICPIKKSEFRKAKFAYQRDIPKK
jgi:tRNA(Ile)-lysidine synthase TilS/MesJ